MKTLNCFACGYPLPGTEEARTPLPRPLSNLQALEEELLEWDTGPVGRQLSDKIGQLIWSLRRYRAAAAALTQDAPMSTDRPGEYLDSDIDDFAELVEAIENVPGRTDDAARSSITGRVSRILFERSAANTEHVLGLLAAATAQIAALQAEHAKGIEEYRETLERERRANREILTAANAQIAALKEAREYPTEDE